MRDVNGLFLWRLKLGMEGEDYRLQLSGAVNARMSASTNSVFAAHLTTFLAFRTNAIYWLNWLTTPDPRSVFLFRHNVRESPPSSRRTPELARVPSSSGLWIMLKSMVTFVELSRRFCTTLVVELPSVRSNLEMPTDTKRITNFWSAPKACTLASSFTAERRLLWLSETFFL